MPLNLKRNTTETPTAQKTQSAPTEAKTPAPQGKKSYLKTGMAAYKTVEQEEARAKERGDEYEKNKNKVWYFFMKPGEERTITFLDGVCDDEGRLLVPWQYEHTMMRNGKFQRYICLSEEGPCPICDGGDVPRYVCLLTCIDHSRYVNAKGQVYENQLRIFSATAPTYRKLQKIAAKPGGGCLAGVTVDVTRDNSNQAAVGDSFMFDSIASVDDLCKKYNVAPLDFNAVETGQYFDAETLISMGFGAAPIGNEAGVSDSESASLAEQL